ncbi:hypothetical protein UY3_02379 [Chelonia mydas]|uniref:Uncharacterized protein n=1 Tax=Chelonia mydas TaxID=8469 RepID=M7C787_CHEMY|nr:hypothetical protein UY3_02379 [Chelonia mydas]
MGDPGSSTSSSAYSLGASSTSEECSEGSPMAGTPSVQLEEEEEDEDMPPEEAAIRVIQKHLQGREEWVRDRAKQLRFLHAIPTLCFSAQKQGQDTLEPHCSRAALVESTAALHKAYADSLDIMLRSLLMETPTMDKLQHLLESSSDFPKVGYLVAQLGLYIFDPAYDISRKPGIGFTGSTSHCCRRGVFGEMISEDQRRSFLQAVLLAIHDPWLCVSQAGLVLAFSIVGEAGHLIGDKSLSHVYAEEESDFRKPELEHFFQVGYCPCPIHRAHFRKPQAVRGLGLAHPRTTRKSISKGGVMILDSIACTKLQTGAPADSPEEHHPVFLWSGYGSPSVMEGRKELDSEILEHNWAARSEFHGENATSTEHTRKALNMDKNSLTPNCQLRGGHPSISEFITFDLS